VLQFDNLKSLSKSLTVVTVKALMSLMLVLLPVHCKCQCTTYSIKMFTNSKINNQMAIQDLTIK